jgi:hypothetical protein
MDLAAMVGPIVLLAFVIVGVVVLVVKLAKPKSLDSNGVPGAPNGLNRLNHGVKYSSLRLGYLRRKSLTSMMSAIV